MTVLADPAKAEEMLLRLRLRLRAKHAPEDPRLGNWRDDPVGWVRDKLGVKPYDRQEEILRAVASHNWTAVVGANGTGKDYAAGRVILWWQSTHRPAKTIVIGPSHRQVSDIVWRECRAAYHAAPTPLGGTMYQGAARWEGGDDHFALGFATDDPYNVQGFHSPNLLVIITEAHAVPQPHVDAIKRLNPRRLLLTGNPLAAAGEFYEAFSSKRDLYHCIRISGMDSPNVRAGYEIIPGLITTEQIEQAKRDWGAESSMFRAYALAEFADAADGVVPLSWVASCRVPRSNPESNPENPESPENTPGNLANELGVDVGAGGDETCVRHRLGMRAGQMWHARTPDPEDACAVVVQAIDETGATVVK